VNLGAPTGTLDLLLQHHVHGDLASDTITNAIQQTALGGHQFSVLPAGSVDRTYIERVARLDYLRGQPDLPSPVEVGVKSILTRVKANYDVVLLDARAGVHDLGGMAMLSVSHATVIVFRPDQQALAGLEVVLPAIAARRSIADRRLVLAASFVPEDPDIREVVLTRWRRLVYEKCSFSGSIYGAPALAVGR